MTNPKGNVTYTVYNDPAHECGTYVGWNATTHTTTGPIQVVREYRPAANASSGQQAVYLEMLTSSATPSYDSGTTAADGCRDVEFVEHSVTLADDHRFGRPGC